MKKLKFKTQISISFLIVLCLSACYEFDFINQPNSADPNSFFDVDISVTINNNTDSSAAYFGVLLPEGWLIGDSVEYSLSSNVTGAFIYSGDLVQLMTSIDPPPENYFWWVGMEDKIVTESGYTLQSTVKIYTNEQTGSFFLDYMLGHDDENKNLGTNGLNFRRSNNHLIIVGDPAGCLPEGITFSTQTEIDSFQINFPNCFETAGNITINGSGITNLSSLDPITTIGGNLWITECDSLENLTGLNNLTSVGGALSIIGNDTLNSLTGLENLTFIGRDLWVETNRNLTGLTELQVLDDIGENLAFIDNDALLSLQGLENVTALGGCLRIEGNDTLISLSGLENLDILASGLILTNNKNLTGINELMGITLLGWDLFVENNKILNSLTGLDNIQSIGGKLRIQSNDSLTALNGLGGLTSIGVNLRITNSAIANLSGLDNLTSIGGELRLGNNYSLTSLSGLENLITIDGSLMFGWGHGVLGFGSYALESLAGLSNLTSIGGNLYVSECSSLINLSGLENLTTIQGGLFIGWSEMGNQNLTNLTGLENLNFVGDYLRISSNDSLISLSALQGLTSVGGTLDISNNDKLPNLSGLENIITVGGDLTLNSNDSFTDLSGIESLMSIGGDLQIDRNDLLLSLAGLENLASIDGDIMIGGSALYEGNPSLLSLSGIENINAGTVKNVHIQMNSSLSNCEVESICNYLAAPNGDIVITDNASGCNSQEEVEEACGFVFCLPEGIILTNQEEIDNFQDNYPDCNVIEGDVTINGEDISNLNGLNVLTAIGGSLLIGDTTFPIIGNPILTSFTGLENLASIGGSFKIAQNSSLLDATGLNSLTSIGGNLSIYGNDSLTSLSGLGNFTSIVGTLRIEGNEMLTSLTGLENLTEIAGDAIIGYGYPGMSSGYFIKGNPSLKNMEGLNNLNSIGGSLQIHCNDSIIDFTGFDNLESIGVDLKIGIVVQPMNGGPYYLGNPLLDNLTGLENLTYIGGEIIVLGNESLTSLHGINNIDPNTITNLDIHHNNTLSSCNAQSICNYLISPNGTVEIYYNATGCNNPPEVAQSCGNTMPCLPHGPYYFFSQSEIDNFQSNYPGCTELNGNVLISGNDITNLNGLIVITSFEGHLKISNNPLLTNLAGLDNVISINGGISIGSFWSAGNPVLTSLSGLGNLISLGGHFSIDNCDSLVNLTGPDNLDSIGGSLIIRSCENLTSLTGLESVVSIGAYLYIYDNEWLMSFSGLENLSTIGGNFIIIGNAFTDFSGLNNLSSIGGELEVYNNHNLTSFSGLENVTSIGGIMKIWINNSLTSLSGLDNINPASISGLHIFYNSSLSTCEVHSICNYLGNPTGTLEILWNAPGCNNQQEVEDACDTGVIISEQYHTKTFTISPNPLESKTLIQYELQTNSLVTLKILDLSGRELVTLVNEIQQKGKQQIVFNTSDLTKGVYFCVLETGSESRNFRKSQTKKIIKL